MKRFGLVGFPLSHSFSKKYFEKKFEKLGLSNTHRYDLLEVEYLKDFPSLWERYPDLEGVNVTIPHKINIIPFLDMLDASVHKVSAVNVVKKQGNKLVGYNSDIFGFRVSLENWMNELGLAHVPPALILGSGGASLAVQTVLTDLRVDYEIISRRTESADYLYTALIKEPHLMAEHPLIINTTPLGMYPVVKDGPPIPYDKVTPDHLLFDLIYNPQETLFMKQGADRGAKTRNGLEMLKLQAEKSWQIWNE
ncbi:MAG: shikimate dehydrogenase [Cyclobacteriaceae bacterium]|nr:shikimate dehydrogenase [Cyclobacteriaceae bacterium]